MANMFYDTQREALDAAAQRGHKLVSTEDKGGNAYFVCRCGATLIKRHGYGGTALLWECGATFTPGFETFRDTAMYFGHDMTSWRTLDGGDATLKMCSCTQCHKAICLVDDHVVLAPGRSACEKRQFKPGDLVTTDAAGTPGNAEVIGYDINGVLVLHWFKWGYRSLEQRINDATCYVPGYAYRDAERGWLAEGKAVRLVQMAEHRKMQPDAETMKLWGVKATLG